MPGEQESACEPCKPLVGGNLEPFEKAPELVRRHVFEASRLSLMNGDEPDTPNPFE